jgi:DNA-binding NtrC family response regulator
MRLLQEQEYYPLGSDTPRTSNARIVAATNRDLRAMMESGRFRQDLFYRLCTHQVTIPPLAARRGDIPLLVEHFVAEAARSINKTIPRVPAELYQYLASYDFPGNVRELKAMAYDSVARHTHGPLSKEGFLHAMGERRPASTAPATEEHPPFLAGSDDRMPTLKEAQEYLIQKALERAQGNQGAAARYLGITRQGLNKILHRTKTSLPPI